MKTFSINALAALVLTAPLTAVAQTPDPTGPIPHFDDRWYIAPFATYSWADRNRGTNDNWGYGLAVGKPLNERFNLELRATQTNFVSKSNIGGNYKATDVAVDGLFFFSRGKFQPFLLAGIGAIQDGFSCNRNAVNAALGCQSRTSWNFMAEAGAGFMVPLGDYVSFRLDGRYRYDNNRGNFNNSSGLGDWIVTAGVVIPLGARSAPAKVTRTFTLSADALFAFDRSDLSPTGRTTINNFSRDLGQANYDAIRVAGHTDPIGSEAYNMALSDRRANTVRGQLVTDGVPGDRISAQGYGKTNLKVTPAECAGTKSRAALIDCYQPNRRVEVTVEGMTSKQ
ncbi:OmpA family protein [uncultured Thiodictyon sp.]|uniref:OmpA family protein n=1 Tax=uncultured Thiodictyon sp. TaxID=1846217 RepID=UPI0025CCD684|nr:OmpA family protein [uncultured Thiodictyon sp.]